MAPQLTFINGPAWRTDMSWMAEAMTSLPTPVSPVTRTGLLVGATWRTRSMTWLNPKSAPIISWPEMRLSSPCRKRRSSSIISFKRLTSW